MTGHVVGTTDEIGPGERKIDLLAGCIYRLAIGAGERYLNVAGKWAFHRACAERIAWRRTRGLDAEASEP